MQTRILIGMALLGWLVVNNRPALADQAAHDVISLVSSNSPESAVVNQGAAPGPVSFKLKPTGVVPASGGGGAKLESRTLALHLSHLDPGRYELEAVRRFDQVREKLGIITIVDPTLQPDRQANDNKKEASAGPDQVRVEADVRITLPAEISPQTISRLVLLDSSGNTVLAGDAE